MHRKHCLGTAALLLISLAGAAPSMGQCTSFSVSGSTGVIVPGTTDVGNHGDDTVTNITLPFNVLLYGQAYGQAAVSSNGNVQFGSTNNGYSNTCIPGNAMGISLQPHWDDLRTDTAGSGIYTSVSGVAPNRVFNIEWRTTYFSGGGNANFEVRLYEDASQVQFVYGTLDQAGGSATVGIQHTSLPSAQYSCNTTGLGNGTQLTFACSNGPIPPQGTGASTPSTIMNCGNPVNVLLTVQASSGFSPPSTGLAVSANLTNIGGSSNQLFYDDGTNGDVTAGDNRFSYAATINGNLPVGPRNITFTVSDAEQRTNTGVFAVNVTACPTAGPDVYIGTLTDMSNYGTVDVDPSAGVVNVTAYSVGTDACNLGDAPVSWIDNNNHPGYGSNEHPVIAQNMYRLKDGRFEQLGQSWLKHGFVSTNSNGCATCQQPPFGGDQLGVNCSDTYGSGLNGSQGGLGPRSQVNATTAVYPFPFSAPAAPATIGRRLQVFTNDVTPALNNGAQYFVDAHYVTQDDAQFTRGVLPATNGLNNHSYRLVNASSLTSGGSPTFAGNTIRFKAGIHAWADFDPTVRMDNADYLDQTFSSAGIIGRFVVGCKVTDNGNGTWHYEYAVYNMNADRNGGSFSVPIDPSAVVTNVGFHGVFAHSGEPYPNTALNLDNWTGAKTGGNVVWSCPEAYNAATGGDDANALRWGTLYNFRFDANVAPIPAAVSVGLFKPATANNTATSASAMVLAPLPQCGSADFDGDGDSGTDADIEAFFACLGGNCCSTCWMLGADFDGDGDVGTDSDIEAFFRVLAGNPC